MVLNANLTVNKALGFNAELDRAAKGFLVNDGWGVFENRSGLSCLPSVTLVDVFTEEDDARTTADRFNEDEGRIVYEVEGDPEANVWLSVHFSAGRVALDDARISVDATYSLVSEE